MWIGNGTLHISEKRKEIEMANKILKYHGVVFGKKVIEFDVPKPDGQVEQTQECANWWKETYTKENGAFWYKVS